MLYRNDNLLAYLAALFVTSISKLLSAGSADAMTGNSNSPGRSIASARAKVLNIQGSFLPFSYFFL